MADYISTNMESGVKVKEALERIESYQPDLFVWTEISDSVTVNLKSPTSYSGIKDPGDYVIYKFSNGPSKIPSTLSPVLLSLRNNKICVTVNNMVFVYDATNDNWVDINEYTDDSTILYIKSNAFPTRTKNTFWFDTSKFDNTENGFIDLKYFNETSQEWESVFNPDSYLKKSELDPDNKEQNIFEYIDSKVETAVGDYGNFLKHINNELEFIHLSADDHIQYAKIITETELQTLIENTYKSALKSSIETAVNTELNTTDLENTLSIIESDYTNHIASHITEANITDWGNKAEKNHTHDYTTGTTKLNASQIVSGIFSADKLPNDIKERYYKITAESPEAEFSNSNITDAMRLNKYHNGNGFYFETTDESNNLIRRWFRIMDNSKIGTTNWADGIDEFTADEVELTWENIENHPMTLEGFGITEVPYTKSEIDGKFNSYNEECNELNTKVNDLNQLVGFEFETPNIGWNMVNVPSANNIWTKACYGNGKFVAVGYDSNAFIYSYDGINWIEGTMSSTQYWYDVCYGNGKFVAISGYCDDYNFNSEDGTHNIFAYSTDGINWTDIKIPQLGFGFNYVCYGNGTFIAYMPMSNKYIYSTDVLNWTLTSFEESPSGWDIRFGNGKFVAALKRNNNSTRLAYSTDGINWGYLTLDMISDSPVIKYCNDRFMLFTDSNLGQYMYSYDGINWVESTLPDKFNVYEACYGNGKYVIFGSIYSSQKYTYVYEYSTDGVNWTYYNSPDNICINDVCYGNGKFVSKINNNTFAYAFGFGDLITIERIGIQAKTKSLTKFDDMATGSTPQVDVIIKTSDNKIYKTTYNTNSEYINYLYNAYSTTNAKEPLGASMTEKYLKEYVSDYYSDSDLVGTHVCYGKESFIATDGDKIKYSSDGINWKIGSSPITTSDQINSQICYGNGKLVIAGTDTNGNGKLFYSTNDGSTWTECTLASTVTSTNFGYVCYGNGKFVAVSKDDTAEFAYSTDGINWNNGLPLTKFYNCNGVIWSETESRFIAISSKLSLNKYLIYAWSTDGWQWTISNNMDFSMLNNPLYIWDNIIIENDSGNILDIINEKYIKFNLDGKELTRKSLLTKNSITGNIRFISKFVRYSNGIIGTFLNVDNMHYILAKTNEITETTNWETLYDLGTEIHPLDIAFGNNHIVVIGMNVSTSYPIMISVECNVKYSWSKDSNRNLSSSIVLPATDTVILVSDGETEEVTDHYIDTTYYKGYLDEQGDGAYKFSGWDKSDVINLDIDSDYMNIISGTWTWCDLVTYSYSWNASDFTIDELQLDNIVSLPNNGESMNAYTTDDIIVDKEYNNSTGISTFVLDRMDMPSSQYWRGMCYGNGRFVAVTYYDSDVFAYSSDGINWTESTMPSSQYWTNIYYINNRFIAVAEQTNIFAYSTDGINWTQGTFPVSQYWKYICYGNGKFVATPYYIASNIFAYSTDGINWTQCTVPVKKTWTGICYGNDMFIAVYTSSAATYIYSTDGINWIEGTMPSTQYWVSVCYGNDKFIAIAQYNNIYAYSSDGINWTEGTMPYEAGNYYYINYINNIYIATNFDGFLYSIDGINWYQLVFQGYMWKSICYGDGKFIFLNDSSTNHIFYVTSDKYIGFSGWNKSDFIITEDTIISGTWSEKPKLTITYSFENIPPYLVTNPPGRTYQMENNLVNIDTTFTNKTGKKVINSTINTSSLPSSQDWIDICYGNGKYIAIAQSTTVYAYSTDGVNWTQGTMPSSSNWRAICYGNGKFVVICSKTNSTSNVFAYSSDGINWTQDTLSSSGYWCSICYGNDKFFAISGSTNKYAYSTDGVSWTVSSYNATNMSNFTSVCYGNGKFVMIKNTNTNVVAYSTTGTSWTTTTLPVSQYWHDICYGNGKFIAVSSGKTFAYSSDGITWTEGTMSITSTSIYWTSVCYGSGKFVAIPTNTANYYVYSIDGINWTSKSFNTFVSAKSVCYGDNGFIIIQSSTDEYHYLLEDAYYQFSGWNKSDFIITEDTIISGTWNKISKAWTEGTLPSDQYWTSVYYGNGKFIAISQGLSRNSYNTNIFAYSSDGINWTQGVFPINKQCRNSVCYGNGKFVVIVYNSNIYMYSSDGITWTQETLPSSANWSSICYGNGKFVILAAHTTVFAYSSDGINWTQGTLPDTGNCSSICYGNGKFIAILYNNISIYSTDGITWTKNIFATSGTYWGPIYYSNNMFIIIEEGLTTNVYIYSTDGITWTSGAMPSSANWSSICYGNGKFVVIAYYSNKYAYSYDGINWIEGTMSSNQYWTSVCYGDGMFISVIYDQTNIFAYLPSDLSTWLNLID